MTIEQTLRAYAENKKQLELLEAQNKEYNAQIVKYMNDVKKDKLPTNLGEFVLAKKTTYKFNEVYEAKVLELEKLEKQQKADGTAILTESRYLRFNPKKDDN